MRWPVLPSAVLVALWMVNPWLPTAERREQLCTVLPSALNKSDDWNRRPVPGMYEMVQAATSTFEQL